MSAIAAVAIAILEALDQHNRPAAEQTGTMLGLCPFVVVVEQPIILHGFCYIGDAVETACDKTTRLKYVLQDEWDDMTGCLYDDVPECDCPPEAPAGIPSDCHLYFYGTEDCYGIFPVWSYTACCEDWRAGLTCEPRLVWMPCTEPECDDLIHPSSCAQQSLRCWCCCDPV